MSCVNSEYGILCVPDDVCRNHSCSITGAAAGRMKFKSIFVFTIFWSLIVYYPLAHMVCGDRRNF